MPRREDHCERSKGCPIGCLAYCFGIPLLIVGILFTILIINNRPPHIKIPPQKLPKPNGWDYFVKAGKMLPRSNQIEMGPVSSTRPQDSWTLSEYEQFMRANAPALAVFREGLGKPYLYPRPKSWNTFENFARLREIARRLLGESMYYEKTSQYAKAVGSLLDCQEFGVEMPRGGHLIVGLVGGAVEHIGSGKQFGLLLPRLSVSELAHVAQRLERIQAKRVLFSDILLEEGRTTAVICAKLYGSAQVRKEVIDPRTWTSIESLKDPRQLYTDLRNVFDNKQNMILETKRYYEAVAKEQRGPYTGKSHIPVPSNVLTDCGFSFSDVVIKAQTAHARAETATKLLQTEIALRRYRFDHGTYPAKLSDLAPKYLKKVPTDPFGLGKPLHYKPTKNGSEFLLYSLGPNLKDDGGMAGSWNGSNTVGDLVAGKW